MQSSINPSIYDNSPPFPYSIHNSSLISGTIDQFPTAAPTAGGPLRTSRSSGPTCTLSLSPLLADLRQEISPSNTVTSNTTAKREHTRITAQTHPVRRNTSEFDGAGDHRFPPIRPPITHDRSRPDLTESLDTALSAWCQRNPPRQWQVFEGQQASIRLQQLLDSFNTAPANTDALAQGPFQSFRAAAAPLTRRACVTPNTRCTRSTTTSRLSMTRRNGAGCYRRGKLIAV